MKKLNLLSLVALMATLLFWSACGGETDDIIITPTSPDLLVTYVDGTDVTTVADTTVEVGSTISININVLRGTNNVTRIEVFEDDVLVPEARLSYASGVTANPLAFFGTGGFDDDLVISLPDLAGDYVYEVVATDSAGLTDNVVFNVTTEVMATPVATITGVLLNQAGPAGQGGLDLDNGDGTGSIAASAEIRDMGINQSLPVAQNWRRRIAAVISNGAEMKSAPAGTSFDDVNSVEAIQELFNTGVDFTETLSRTDTDGTMRTYPVSAVVQVDDIFVVQSSGGKVYLLEVTAVTPTTNNNADSYTFSIKQAQ